MKRNQYLAVNSGRIDWIINENAPKEYRFKSNRYLALINPNYYNSLKRKRLIPKVVFHLKTEDKYLASTEGLLFKKYNAEDDIKFLETFLNQLRFISKQATVKANRMRSIYPVEIKDLKFISDVYNAKDARIRKSIIDTSIKWDDLKTVDNRIKNKIQIPIHIEILIDAWEEIQNGEYRKTILFSTIAIESMLASKLDASYNSLISNGNIKSKFRLSEFTNSDGKFLKDPIYSKLKEKKNIGILMHEMPLYLWNKSLLLENEALYEKAKRLYSTRNKIVHLGEHDNTNEQLLPINRDGALEAFNTAKKIFKWCDIDEFEDLEIDKFIKL